MPPVRSLTSKCRTRVVAVILLLGEIMPIYSRCTEKKLVCIIITAPSSRQPSSCVKYTKSDMCLSCNIRSVSDAKYILKFLCDILSLSQLLGGNTW